jgi:hypothetical protein
MSKLETDLTRWYWREIEPAGTLVEEFCAVRPSETCGVRLLDGLIVHGDPVERVSGSSYEGSVQGKAVTVIQTKDSRLGMYLMGQTLFSTKLMERLGVASVKSVAVCTEDDSVLRPYLEDFPQCKVVVVPKEVADRYREENQASEDDEEDEGSLNAAVPETLVADAERIWSSLQRAERIPGRKVSASNVPAERGIYVWYSQNGEPVYVGKATGSRGIRYRVMRQHLNPKYLEKRSEKFTEDDAYQCEVSPTLHGRVCVDQSAFRKNVARAHRLKPGQESVDYLRDNFELAWVVLPEASGVRIAELERAVRGLLLERPRYNRAK